MKRIGVVAKTHSPDAPKVVPALVRWLRRRHLEVLTEPATAKLGLEGACIERSDRLPQLVDLLIVLGGDGTLISASRSVKRPTTPILAVNLGSLGFLTVVTLPELYGAISRVLAGDYSLSQRFLLEVDYLPAAGSHRVFRVLNDAVVSKTALSRMIRLATYVDGRLLCRYQADGLIVATPTGSTAYSLSAGGPIVFPGTEAIVVSPICPHQLTNRSVVFPASVCVEVVLETELEEVTLTLDGQIGIAMHHRDRLSITRSCHSVGLVRFDETDYFEIWRKKLHWGRREND